MSEFDFDVVTGPAIPVKTLARLAPNADAPRRPVSDAKPAPTADRRAAEVPTRHATPTSQSL
jgi:hypothetical protein